MLDVDQFTFCKMLRARIKCWKYEEKEENAKYV